MWRRCGAALMTVAASCSGGEQGRLAAGVPDGAQSESVEEQDAARPEAGASSAGAFELDLARFHDDQRAGPVRWLVGQLALPGDRDQAHAHSGWRRAAEERDGTFIAVGIA